MQIYLILECSFHTNIHALEKSGTAPGNDESVKGNNIGDLTVCKTMLTLVVTDAKKFEGMGLVEK